MKKDFSELLEAMAEMIAERVVAKLGARERRSDSAIYTSRDLPPDCPSRARFNILAKSIARAQKSGRVWSVPRDAWHAFRDKPRHATPLTSQEEADLAYARECLRAAGLRPTRNR